MNEERTGKCLRQVEHTHIQKCAQIKEAENALLRFVYCNCISLACGHSHKDQGFSHLQIYYTFTKKYTKKSDTHISMVIQNLFV